MPRKKSRRQAKSTGTGIALTLKAITAVIGALALAAVAYYKWASKIAGSKRKVAAYLAPVGLIGVVSIIGLAAPSESVTEPTPHTAYEYNHDFEAADVAKAEPVEEIESEITIEPEPYVAPESEPYTEPESYVAPEPVSTGTGCIDGSCKELKTQGLGPFYPGDANSYYLWNNAALQLKSSFSSERIKLSSYQSSKDEKISAITANTAWQELQRYHHFSKPKQISDFEASIRTQRRQSRYPSRILLQIRF